MSSEPAQAQRERERLSLRVTSALSACVWVGVIASIALGVDVRPVVQEALNSGQTIEHAFVLAILVPTIVFLLARSVIGWLRWKLQRELWRRDVERLSRGD